MHRRDAPARRPSATHPAGGIEIAGPEFAKNNSSAPVAAGNHECSVGRMGRWVIVVDVGLKGLKEEARKGPEQGGKGGRGRKVAEEARVVSELRVRNFKLRSPRG